MVKLKYFPMKAKEFSSKNKKIFSNDDSYQSIFSLIEIEGILCS